MTFKLGALATAAGITLVASSTPGQLAWHEGVDRAQAGVFSLEPGTARVLLAPGGDGEPVDVTGQARVVADVGDDLRVELPITIRVGHAQEARLVVDVPEATGDDVLAAELAATPATLAVTPVDGGPQLAPVEGEQRTLRVDPGADGHTYTVAWTTTTRPTRDGAERTRDNWWGTGPTSLQGLAVGARPMVVSTTATDPATAGSEAAPLSAQARTVVPAIQMDTATLTVSDETNDAATLRPIGTGALDVHPVSVTVTPAGPSTDDDLERLLAAGRLGARITTGETECGDDARWSVAPGALTAARPSAVPTTDGEATDRVDGPRRVCVTMTHGVSRDQLVSQHAGQMLTLTTTWRAATPAPASWTATTTTRANAMIPLPPPVAATRACTPAARSVAVHWTWPSPTSSPARGAIVRWSIHARPAGSSGAWRSLGTVQGGSQARSQRVYAAALRRLDLGPGEYDLVVRAHPRPAADDRYVESASTWRVTLPARGAPTCGPAGENAGALVGFPGVAP